MHAPSRQSRLNAAAIAIVACVAALGICAPGATAGKKASIPSTNLTENPSFKRSTKGWQGTDARLRRVRDRKAPNGRTAAKVGARAGIEAYWLNGAPAKLRDGATSGADYTGTAWVRASGRTGGRKVTVVVRETTNGGELVQDSFKTVKLRRSYRQVTVSLTAKRDGSVIDMYLSRPEGDVVKGDSFYADALTVTADTPPAAAGSGAPGGAAPSTVGQIAIINTHEELIRHEQGSRYRYLVVRDGMHESVDELRAANPNSDILLYKDLSFTIRDEPGCPYAPYEVTGVSYCTANSHEGWFLHDSASGQRLTSSAYPNLYAMDLADAGYRQAWLSAVRARLVDAAGDGSGVRWDGVYLDDTNLYPGHGMDGRIQEATGAQYREATLDFVANVSPALQAEGFVTMANVGMDMYDPAQRAAAKQLAHNIDVYNREYFVRWSDSPVFTTPHASRGNEWTDELVHMEEIQRAGASFSAVVYGDTTEAEVQRYARATFLLGWDGTDGGALMYRASGASDGWLADWTTDVGYPVEARQAVGKGWQRDYTAGTVIINPHPSGNQTFALGGSYRLPSGSCTDSVDLGPASALVLPRC